MQDTDVISNIGDSIIQHGKLNNRIYLMKLSEKDFPSIITKLDDIVKSKKYSKIFAKIPEYAKDEFINNNYITEAIIPAFYGTEDAYFVSKFFGGTRNIDNNIEDINKILYIAKNKNGSKDIKEKDIQDKDIQDNIDIQQNFKFGTCQESHSYHMADVYRKVFKTYPFPIFDAEYIKKTMKENFKYFFISDIINNKIVALSSSEMDIDSKTVEMTDFATLPEFQGKGLAIYLLQKMEDAMLDMDMKISYTISRSLSYGINIIFAKMRYKYGGLLLNNTNICGNFESMNVWYKNL